MWKLALILFLFTSCHSKQSSNTIVCRVTYSTTSKTWQNSEAFHTENITLDITPSQSRFYGRLRDRRNEVLDSLKAVGDTITNAMQIYYDYPVEKQSYAVYKNYPQKGLLTYTDVQIKNYVYEEELEKPKWNKVKGDTIIAGYPCKKATTRFRDKVWEVWYTPNITYKDGPWKLWGLPGLIMMATEEQSRTSFVCKQVESIEGGKLRSAYRPKMIKCTHQQLKDIMLFQGKDIKAYLESIGYPSQGWDAEGKPLVYKPKVPVLLD